MASRKSFLSKPSNYFFFPSSSSSSSSSSSDHILEFDESELWNNNNNNTNMSKTNNTNNNKKTLSTSSRSSSLKRTTCVSRNKVADISQKQASCSLPVNIPDWSKILKDEYKQHNSNWESHDDDEEEDDEDHDNGGRGIRVPPHEYLARTRGASFSVHEGIGRTLKGRDLCSVRNAIWKKVGFED